MGKTKQSIFLPLADGIEITDQDKRMVEMLTRGDRPKDIGLKEGISSRTVEARLDKLRLKTGSETIPELIAKLFRSGLIK